MKKTIIIQNRFTTYIRSWWAKSSLLFLSLVVILFSCEEDLNFLGFKSNQQRFKVFYAEIPVQSSVLWMDSLRTSVLSGELSRLLIGKYVDPIFGTIESKAFAQFRPLAFPTISSAAVYDSVVLKWRYDFYAYGTPDETTQSLSIYEISQVLKFEDDYFFNTSVSIGRIPIGETEARVNAAYFKQELANTATDSILTTKIKLSDNFGRRLFDAVNPEDTLFTNLTYFVQQFKGLAIVPTQADKIFGITTFDANTVLTIHYHEVDVQKTISFSLANLVAFSQISANRSGTELAGLNSFYTNFDPGINRYVQNGTSIITKLDFSKFYEYMDTIPNVMINSAELSISDVSSSDEFAVPGNMTLAMVRLNNRFKTIRDKQDTLDIAPLSGSLVSADMDKPFASSDLGGIFSMPYSTTDKNYLGYPTLFFQRLFNSKQYQYPYWALVPSDPPSNNGKAVNRAVFPKEAIKLKIYYTRPLINENP
ncbi:MAG: DUF4270 family protein [Cyclobacteriaceae bacterium]|nr:DUF4270 family protein [Cyclobacteriaceae bacterium]